VSITDRVAHGAYRGVWAVLRRWFRVSDEPPTLPTPGGEPLAVFRPAPGYLRYLTLQFWVALLLIDGLILLGWIAIVVNEPVIGAMLALPMLIIAVVPDVIAYVVLHLRYDTMWYVMSDRSLRLRHGVLVVHEMTFTFENVQNVSVQRGPLQQYFGIANVIVQTAGGGGAAHPAMAGAGHVGVLCGVANADALRDTILARVNASRTAGLGDERHGKSLDHGGAFTAAHIAVLREIRNTIVARQS